MKTSIHQKKNKLILVFKLMSVLFMFLTNGLFAQLVINTTMTPTQLVQDILVGSGVTVTNVTYNGAVASYGSFTGGGGTNLGLESGIIMSTGDVSEAPGLVSNFASTTNGTDSDPQLAALIPLYDVYDAAVLEFDFIPEADTLKFRYVFGSEEYPEYVSSSFNDVFGFFVTGPNPSGGNYTNKNIALIPGTTLPVTIDNVNNVIPSYQQYYIDNEALGGTTIVYDGFTTVLTAWCLVTPCVQYHIKIAIGDAGDHSYDSAVFLEENSFSSGVSVGNVSYSVPGATAAIEGCSDAIISFTTSTPVTSPFTINIISVGGSATEGTDYTDIPASVTIPTGQDSVGILILPYYDGATEGDETVILVIQTSPCGYDTLTITIKDYINIETFANDTMLCMGQTGPVSIPISVSVSGGLSPVIYHWSNDAVTSSTIVTPSVTTTYTVTVSDICGLVVDTVVVTVYPKPVISIIPDNPFICSEDTISLTATGADSYIWSPSAGLSSTTGATVDAFPLTTTTYTVTGTDNNGCSDTATVVVSVFPSPNVEFTAYPYSDCEPLWAAFTDNSTSDSSIISWLWNFGDPESGSNTSTEQNPSHFYNYDGTYNVTLSVTTINGCIEIYTSHGMITVYPQPEANFYAQPEVALTQNPVISFTDQSSNNTSYWNWNFGDPGSGINNTSTEQNPSHTYNSEGIYDVLLIISNYNNTCFDTIIKQVEIVNLTIPNVFTPNNDGKNDCFHIINIEKLKNNQLIIFNRWGNLIYEKSNYQNDWDGKNCPAGVYYYILKLPDNNSNYHDSGTVTIIR